MTLLTMSGGGDSELSGLIGGSTCWIASRTAEDHPRVIVRENTESSRHFAARWRQPSGSTGLSRARGRCGILDIFLALHGGSSDLTPNGHQLVSLRPPRLDLGRDRLNEFIGHLDVAIHVGFGVGEGARGAR